MRETSALHVCTGVAVGGVIRHADGSVADTSVSVFHVLPSVSAPGLAIARKIRELSAQGFEVNAFVAGGDGTAQAGRQQRYAIEAMLSDLGVPFGKGPFSDGESPQILSATIQANGEIEYENSRFF
ncbi:hypothetical protein [Paraburkholderia aspalathi]|uniref:hypothetical protein n=1 Tax=Paraburkholderia aspalathi TaxID=1324617 RepID=UPI00190B9419|nr:hypothetical protein [Paraburkholderia aspalathi]MBK3844037.1 hypothetical protein [Paraburkholderia aspalathi]